VWGVGVHPSVNKALEQFDYDIFTSLVDRTSYVGEVGLDGKVKSQLATQRHILGQVLTALQERPRITSLHSYNATNELIEMLEEQPIRGLVLHWWLGDVPTTRRAIELGAYFSVNFAGLSNEEALREVPLDRILTETDHPDGDRRSAKPRQPGNVTSVEIELARRYGLHPQRLREVIWSNLRALTRAVAVTHLIPPRVNTILAEAKIADT
jgi:TatD DNase family protein